MAVQYEEETRSQQKTPYVTDENKGRLQSSQTVKPMNPIMKFFEYRHLPLSVQGVSADICDIAHKYEGGINDGPEKSAGLRKLLEAKDCFVRAAL